MVDVPEEGKGAGCFCSLKPVGWHAEGINDSGAIVGGYDSNGVRKGFIATPVPIPSTLFLLGAGLAMGNVG